MAVICLLSSATLLGQETYEVQQELGAEATYSLGFPPYLHESSLCSNCDGCGLLGITDISCVGSDGIVDVCAYWS